MAPIGEVVACHRRRGFPFANNRKCPRMPRCSPAEREKKKDKHICTISCPSAPNGEPLGSGSFVYIPRRTVTRRRPRLFTTRRRSSAPPTQASAETPHIRLACLISRRRATLRPPSASRLLSQLRGLIASLSVACRR